jgi:hypothetical protein
VSLLLAVLMGCSGSEPPPPSPAPTPAPAPAPAPAEVGLPEASPVLPEREATLPQPLATWPELLAARKVLADAVHTHGRDPDNPWAVGHAMLALGPDIELTNGVKAADHLFAAYAEWVELPGDDGVAFPRKRGDIRIEPHSDLLLKALTEGGVAPDRQVAVGNKVTEPSRLWRHSVRRAWVDGSRTGFDSMNDLPWALQGIAHWAPPELSWTAVGGRSMSLTGLTHDATVHLKGQSQQLLAAKAAGQVPQKDGKGILGYTCGGHHFVQGVAHAHARGFGADDDRALICEQQELMRWRIDHELGSIDPLLAQHGTTDKNVAIVLLDQRLKFLGHYLETASKLGAYQLCEWTDADAKALKRAADELVRTVQALDGLGVYALQAVRSNRGLDPYRANSGGAEQVYLDLLGDAAHAVRGIDLATGQGVVRY